MTFIFAILGTLLFAGFAVAAASTKDLMLRYVYVMGAVLAFCLAAAGWWALVP